jgi:hypothetical protein
MNIITSTVLTLVKGLRNSGEWVFPGWIEGGFIAYKLCLSYLSYLSDLELLKKQLMFLGCVGQKMSGTREVFVIVLVRSHVGFCIHFQIRCTRKSPPLLLFSLSQLYCSMIDKSVYLRCII